MMRGPMMVGFLGTVFNIRIKRTECVAGSLITDHWLLWGLNKTPLGWHKQALSAPGGVEIDVDDLPLGDLVEVVDHHLEPLCGDGGGGVADPKPGGMEDGTGTPATRLTRLRRMEGMLHFAPEHGNLNSSPSIPIFSSFIFFAVLVVRSCLPLFAVFSRFFLCPTMEALYDVNFWME